MAPKRSIYIDSSKVLAPEDYAYALHAAKVMPCLIGALENVKTWCELNRRETSVIYKPVCEAIAKAK